MTYLESEKRKPVVEFWNIQTEMRLIDNDLYHLHTDPPEDQREYERIITKLILRRNELLERALDLRNGYNIYITDLNKYY